MSCKDGMVEARCTRSSEARALTGRSEKKSNGGCQQEEEEEEDNPGARFVQRV